MTICASCGSAARRAVSTTKAYAENLALFFDWVSRSGCAVDERAARARPVRALVAELAGGAARHRVRPGAQRSADQHDPGQRARALQARGVDGVAGRAGAGRAVSWSAMTASTRRTCAARTGCCGRCCGRLHRVPEARRASVDDAKPEEFAGLLGACEHWRDRFLLARDVFRRLAGRGDARSASVGSAFRRALGRARLLVSGRASACRAARERQRRAGEERACADRAGRGPAGRRV